MLIGPTSDPAGFRPRRVEPPAWADRGVTFDERVTRDERLRLLEQLPEMSAALDATLDWAFGRPDADPRLGDIRNYLLGNAGTYYAGRHHVAPAEGPQRYLVEVECCLLAPGVRQVWRPCYLVTLRWDAATRQGSPALSRGPAELARLTYRLVRTRHPSDVPDLDVSQPARDFLAQRWDDLLGLLQRAATEAVESDSGSGELDDWRFPNRVVMTGAYAIAAISEPDPGSLVVVLHFEERPCYEGQTDLGYLGHDLVVPMTDGPLSAEPLGSHSI